jgi:hypothetical protein
MGRCITLHELPLADIRARAAEGRISDAKTLILIQALKIRRSDLFA